MAWRDTTRQAWRMLRRDWRAGELNLLLVALVLAVGALTSVGFLADRMNRGLERDARQMLAADVSVRADQPLPPDFAQEAAHLGLRTAQTAVFPTMATVSGVMAGDQTKSADADRNISRLVSLKAVSAGYPLRGALRISPDANPASKASDKAASGIPAPGTVWVDTALLDALHLHMGSAIHVGNRQFTVAAIITREMDRGYGFASLSPRVMMRWDELPPTGLVQFGSRITYRLLVAGPDRAVAAYRAWAGAQIAKRRGIVLETLEDGRPYVHQTLDRAGRFLSLVALLAAVLAAVAIGIGAHRYSTRHLDACAVMRCMGINRGTLRGIVAIEFSLLALMGGVVGLIVGYGAHLVLLHAVAGVIPADLPPPSWHPAAMGLASGFVLLLGFALPPLLPLADVPPVRALRREWGLAARRGWWAYGASGLVFCVLLLVSARDTSLGLMVAAGFAVGTLAFGAIAWLAIAALAALARRRHDDGGNGGIGWRYALAGLRRRGAGSAVQVTALALGLMALLLLSMTRNDLLAGWRQATPPDAPNRFIIDIQPEQQHAVLARMHLDGLHDAALSPMVRARLTAINGHSVTGQNFADARARRLAEREFNLSYTTALPDGNRITAGHWYGSGAVPQISMEAGIARTLGLKLGDTLRFEVAGQAVQAPITSLRKLEWGSMRVNFFVLMPPSALKDFPATWITAVHLGDKQQAVADDLVQRFPNLTIIDTSAILTQVQHILTQVIDAVQFLFVFTLAAGVLVLYAALAGTRDERMREAGLLRALGASARQIRRVHVAELITVGALAGLMAAIAAGALGWLLARHVFEFSLRLDGWLPIAGAAAGIICALAGGWTGLRAVLRQPALRTLREI